MDAGRIPIRTPDQRIRVFVSSTLKELEAERKAVRTALEQLHLAPVMFELGARPHPPRSLYRSYLEQSDIFVGIYWERYGWVAPDEQISGLEDEYRLSGGLPALIYIKEPAPEREPRLEELLDRVRDDDRTSYKSFTGPDDLAQLLTGDLATLLAERFDASVADAGTAAHAATDIPSPYSAIVGRDREKRELLDLLAVPDNRIVTIVGPGGVGKSRLAIEVALASAAAGRDVAFAALESVATPARAITAIARALGVRDTCDQPLEQKVSAAIEDREVLLVVDNMEHLLEASDMLVRLVTDAARLQLLVTSRSPLRVRAERVYTLDPLPTPVAGAKAGDAVRSAAVNLFVQRAVAVQPSFRLTAANVDAVVEICRRLDGMPLAIELAAARVRALTPQQLLERLDSALSLLVSGARDLPERQRALRDTIQWSVDLLDGDARRAFSALSVFAGRFSLASAERVLAAYGVADPLAALEALVDASLLHHGDHEGEPTFRFISLVRVFATQQLDDAGRNAATAGWIDNYWAVARQAATALRGRGQLDWLSRLELEVEDLARVERTLLDSGRLDDAADFAWSLYLFLWIGGYLGVVRGWMTELVDLAAARGVDVQVRTRAIALYYVGAIRFWEERAYDPLPGLRESRALFAESGDRFGAGLAGVSVALGLLGRVEGPDVAGATTTLEESLADFRAVSDAWGEAMALVMLGRIAMLQQDMAAALERFQESFDLASSQEELLGLVIAQNHRGWARFLSGDAAGAREDFADGLDRSLALGHDEGVAYGLEGFVGLRALAGDARGAGLLLGAARTLRVRRGLVNLGAFEFYEIPLGALRQAGLGDELDRATDDGRALTTEEALEHVRG